MMKFPNFHIKKRQSWRNSAVVNKHLESTPCFSSCPCSAGFVILGHSVMVSHAHGKKQHKSSNFEPCHGNSKHIKVQKYLPNAKSVLNDFSYTFCPMSSNVELTSVMHPLLYWHFIFQESNWNPTQYGSAAHCVPHSISVLVIDWYTTVFDWL